MTSPELKLMQFLQEYTEVLNEHLASTKSQIDVSVEQAMEVVQDFSQVTDCKKSEAEALMEKSYLAPDDELKKIMNYTQKTTDLVIELAQNGVIENTGNHTPNLRDSANDMRMMTGIFSKHMESMTRIEDDTRDFVMAIVGNLSNGDVMRQRLEHVYDGLTLMNEKLRTLMSSLPRDLSCENIASLKNSLLEETYSRYSMEEEKVAFKLIFGPPPHILKAYYKRSV